MTCSTMVRIEYIFYELTQCSDSKSLHTRLQVLGEGPSGIESQKAALLVSNITLANVTKSLNN